MAKNIPAFFRRKDILTSQILYIIREEQKTVIHMLDGRTVSTYITLKDLHANLPESEFIRVNKSYVLPIAQIAEINDGIYLMTDGRTFSGRVRSAASHKRLGRAISERQAAPSPTHQSAMETPFSSYYKVLKANLTTDTYEILSDDSEKSEGDGFSSLSEWLRAFAESGRVHPEDRNRFLADTDIQHLQLYFLRRDRSSPFVFCYRRLSGGEFRWVQMEILPMEGYTHQNQIVSLYVKDIQDFYQEVPYTTPSLSGNANSETIFYVDLDTDSVMLYHPGGFFEEDFQDFLQSFPSRWSQVPEFMQEWSSPDSQKPLRRILRTEHLQMRFSRKDFFSQEIQLVQNGQPLTLRMKFSNLSNGRELTQFMLSFAYLSRKNQTSPSGSSLTTKLLVISTDAPLIGALSTDYPVVTCSDLNQAVHSYKSSPSGFALILADFEDLGLDSLHALSYFLENTGCRSTPIVVTSSIRMEPLDKALMDQGAACLISKPFHPEILRQCVKHNIMLNEVSGLLSQFQRDGLTGLYERQAFFQYAGNYIAQHTELHFQIIVSDIDNFKVINERIGRKQGNSILHRLSNYLPTILPGCVMGSRLSGDVFAFLLQDPNRSQLTDALRKMRSWETEEGVVVRFGLTDVDPRISLFSNCDHATMVLDSIKGVYGKQLAEFNDAFRQSLMWKRQLGIEAEQALQSEQFRVYYQPKQDLATGIIGGAESLVRWEHPEHGPIPPGQFIPIYESSGFIAKLDLYIIDQVCADIERWQSMGLPPVPISVNLSRRDFEQDDLADQLCAIVDSHGLPHSLIHFELTESAFTSAPEKVPQIAQQIRRSGFLLELDDFGSGYSSLVTLTAMELDYLKIDKSLVDQIATPSGEKIISAILSLARSLGMKVVAEGVEQGFQMRALMEMNCDILQGYLYSKPLPCTQFTEFLRSRR